MTQFMKNEIHIITVDDLDIALRYAEPFDKQGIDVHIKKSESLFDVFVYLPANYPIATMRGGVLQSIENMPPGWRLLVANYDDESKEPVAVRVERGFNYKLDIEAKQEDA